MADYTGTTALLVIDVQHDFAHPDGSLYVAGGEEVVPLVNAEADQALTSGALVVYTQDWHPPNTPHFEKDGGIWPVHCVGGTWGAAFHADLEVRGPTIRKGTAGEDGYSGFYVREPDSGAVSSTGLGELLQARGVTAVVVVGLATDYCVRESAVDAVGAGFATTLLADAIRPVNLAPGDGSRAIAAMVAAGVVVK